ncbi:MAG: hypothetical protein FWE91_09965 [Defluviitaleaceae bacterium]|nr:hypothetical protein [Defluviitaleaceae bacterium]MCL2835824.1 hypothetical protein [Defluviitaleaceae bacterium]
MKKFIKDWLMNFAIIVIVLYVFDFILYGQGGNKVFIFQLLFVTLLIRLLAKLTSKFISLYYPVLEYLLEFAMVNIVVLGSGLLLKWFRLENIWHPILVIAVVYAAAFVLDLTRTNRDIAFINEQIKRRRGFGK